MNLRFCVPQFDGVSDITCIAQVLFKSVVKTLLVDKRWFSFSHFKIAFNLLADKHWRHGRRVTIASSGEIRPVRRKSESTIKHSSQQRPFISNVYVALAMQQEADVRGLDIDFDFHM